MARLSLAIRGASIVDLTPPVRADSAQARPPVSGASQISEGRASMARPGLEPGHHDFQARGMTPLRRPDDGPPSGEERDAQVVCRETCFRRRSGTQARLSGRSRVSSFAGTSCVTIEVLAGTQKQQSARRPSAVWKERSDRVEGRKLWPLTATQPTVRSRLRLSRSIGLGAGSSVTKAERAAGLQEGEA
jgi:hypothetical protein